MTSYSTVSCDSKEGCKLYEMKRTDLLKLLRDEPELTIDVAKGLSEEVCQIAGRMYVTPLLEQKGGSGSGDHHHGVNYPAVALGAGIESYYRSALNAMLNSRLVGDGVKRGELFPNMHIQVPVPTRIAYMTGFKGWEECEKDRNRMSMIPRVFIQNVDCSAKTNLYFIFRSVNSQTLRIFSQ